MFLFFFFKQKTAYEVRISDWSSDVCSSDLVLPRAAALRGRGEGADPPQLGLGGAPGQPFPGPACDRAGPAGALAAVARRPPPGAAGGRDRKCVVKGQSVSRRGGLGGRRTIKKNQHKIHTR